MNIKFSRPKAIEKKDIEFFAQALGCSIPDDLQRFFLDFNGSKPETNNFTISENNGAGINELIPISKIIEERKYLDHLGERAFPVAEAEGGNYVVIDLDQDQSVYFWDHEEPQNMTKLASNIHEFLSTLMPFDPYDVELKDGQIKSVWVDPDFLKSLK